MMLCKKHLGATLAGLGVVAYVVCHFWGFVVPADVQELHADLLRISVLGWSGMNLTSFILGIVQWAIWGWLIGAAFATIGKWCATSCSMVKK
ncbi:hypothetical protein GW777_00300 [Candidatus Peregrinibacteria bacterium]|uniref:Uncharacterized protein n=1 Tax=Candidatus Uhrbacteria bacterium CG_4_9_14_3_um_filter_50_9 TaxID=1975035 RepID=A0A2M7XD00_9BACT|nr:hypothetical protein [Candidatus Peregrinibacteria bacterium]PJA45702.1 MAG: hypothetical protein CO174_01780 [Candidatus Uhrbacteria bacterium CG_4_9_14_3_um_filter_50_9]